MMKLILIVYMHRNRLRHHRRIRFDGCPCGGVSFPTFDETLSTILSRKTLFAYTHTISGSNISNLRILLRRRYYSTLVDVHTCVRFPKNYANAFFTKLLILVIYYCTALSYKAVQVLSTPSRRKPFALAPGATTFSTSSVLDSTLGQNKNTVTSTVSLFPRAN
jgi:hypothetical protein